MPTKDIVNTVIRRRAEQMLSKGLGNGGMRHTVIIGGGITGLATAFHLQRAAHNKVAITLLEDSPHLGGKITTHREGGFLIEGGPDSFISRKPATLDLCRALGLDAELIGTNPAEHSTYVLCGGRLHAFPDGVLPMAKSGLVSWPGKLRMAAEMFVPARLDEDDESLAGFIRRRMGAEALDKLAAPLLAGIYAADPEKLSLQSTFPVLPAMEKKYGTVLRGYITQQRNRNRAKVQPGRQKPSMFTTLRGGLDRLVETLALHLTSTDIRLNTHALAVMPFGGGYEILLHDGTSLCANDVVFATPAYVTAGLVQEMDDGLAEQLRAIRYVSTATVSLGFRAEDLKRPLDGYGFVVPRQEDRIITACSWSSAKFAARAPEGFVLLRVFMGGAAYEDVAKQEETALVELARYELRAAMGIAAHPVVARAYRWRRGNPQYDMGHLARVAQIEQLAAQHPGLHLAGAAYRGAGVPDCIESGIRVASRIAEQAAASCHRQPQHNIQEHVYG